MPERKPYEPKSDAELERIAQDMAAGRIYSTAHMDDLRDARMVFLPLTFLDQPSIEWMRQYEVTFIYEYLSEAGPRSVNGKPSFMSMKWLSKSDADRMMVKYKEIYEFLEARKPKTD